MANKIPLSSLPNTQPPKDITTTGGHDLKGVRNTDLYNDQLHQEILQSSVDLQKGRLGYSDTSVEGTITPKARPDLGDYGASSYDTDILVNPINAGTVQDVRADNQGSLSKFVNAVPLAITTAGTTFAQGTLGLLWGAGSAIKNGEFNKLWNNDFTEAMDSVQKAVNEQAPIYQTQDEQANPLSNLMSASVASQLLGQATGFIAGAAYSGSTYMKIIEGLGKGFDAIRAGKGAFRAINQLATSSKNNIATQAAASLLGANGEATIEAFSNTQDWKQLEHLKLQDHYDSNSLEFFTQAANTATQEINPANFNTREEYIQAIKERATSIVQESYASRAAKIEDEALKMGNVIWAENMALLAYTHFKTLGRIYSGSYRANKTLANFVKSTIKDGKPALEAVKKGTIKNIAGSLGVAGYEGFEEIAQGSIAKGAGYWSENDLYDPIREKRNEYGEAQTFGLITSLAEGVKDQVADPNNWVEFIMGTAAAMLPIPIPHRKSNGKIGVWRSPEMINTFKENLEMNKLATETVDRVNKMMEDPQYQTLADALIVDAVKEDKKKANINDQFTYKNENYSQLVNLVTALEQVDRLDLFTDTVQEVLDMDVNAENGQAIIEGLSKDGEVPQYLQNKVPEQVAQIYKDKAKDILDDVQKIANTSENIRATYGDKLTPEALSILTNLKSQLDNWDKRYSELAKTIPIELVKNGISKNANVSRLLQSIIDPNTPLQFTIANEDAITTAVTEVVDTYMKSNRYDPQVTTQDITANLVDMYRLGMSLGNGLAAFKSIVSNPDSFNLKVEKVVNEENNKQQQKNVDNLQKQFENVSTIKEFNALQASANPEDAAVFKAALKASKNPKLIELNKKINALINLTDNLETVDNIDPILDIIKPAIEDEIDTLSSADLLEEGVEKLFDVAIDSALSRINPADIGLSDADFDTLKTDINSTIAETLKQRRENAKRTANTISTTTNTQNKSTTSTSTSSITDSLPNDFFPEDIFDSTAKTKQENTLKEIDAIVNPQSEISENATAIPGTGVEDTSVETVTRLPNQIAGSVTEVNYRAFKDGKVITPANRDEWNQYADIPIDENFTKIYNYLVEHGAYQFLNSGKLKVDQHVIAFIDKKFGSTVFFGVLKEGKTEAQSIDDIQVIQAAPSNYSIEASQVIDTGNLITDTRSLRVSKIYNGKYLYTTEDSPLSIEEINTLFPTNTTPDWTIGVVSNNGTIYASKDLNEDDIAHDNPFTVDQDGRVYLFIKGPNGKYIPMSLFVANFTDIDESTPFGRGISKAIDTMSIVMNDDGTYSKDNLKMGITALSKYLYTGNIVPIVRNKINKAGIQVKYLTFIVKNATTKAYTFEDIPLQTASLTDGIINRSTEDVKADIITALQKMGVHYQVAKNALRNDRTYVSALLASNILSSNVARQSLVETNFVLVEDKNDSSTINTVTPTPTPGEASPVTIIPPVSNPVIQPSIKESEADILKKITSFNIDTFADIFATVPKKIQDMLKGVNGTRMSIKKQLMLATILLLPENISKKLGGTEGLIVSLAHNKPTKFLQDMLDVGIQFNKHLIDDSKQSLYTNLREKLMGLTSTPITTQQEPTIDTKVSVNSTAQSKTETPISNGLDLSAIAINGFKNAQKKGTESLVKKNLDISKNSLTFVDLSNDQKLDVVNVLLNTGMSVEEFNKLSREEQDKIIKCNK